MKSSVQNVNVYHNSRTEKMCFFFFRSISSYVYFAFFIHSFAKFELYHHLVINHFNFKMQNASAQYVSPSPSIVCVYIFKNRFHFRLILLSYCLGFVASRLHEPHAPPVCYFNQNHCFFVCFFKRTSEIDC